MTLSILCPCKTTYTLQRQNRDYIVVLLNHCTFAGRICFFVLVTMRVPQQEVWVGSYEQVIKSNDFWQRGLLYEFFDITSTENAVQ